MSAPFRDRSDAGRQLGARLAERSLGGEKLVLALPRGGVPVGWEVSRILGAPLDVMLVRKLGAPGFPELAMGAIASGGVLVRNESVLYELPRAEALFSRVAEFEARELARRESQYREGRPSPDLAGKTVLLVDDGLATGSTMRAAIVAARRLGAARIVVGVPVGAAETCTVLAAEADELVCVHIPPAFGAVGQFYQDFQQTTDDEVRTLLARAAEAAPHHA